MPLRRGLPDQLDALLIRQRYDQQLRCPACYTACFDLLDHGRTLQSEHNSRSRYDSLLTGLGNYPDRHETLTCFGLTSDWYGSTCASIERANQVLPSAVDLVGRVSVDSAAIATCNLLDEAFQSTRLLLLLRRLGLQRQRAGRFQQMPLADMAETAVLSQVVEHIQSLSETGR